MTEAQNKVFGSTNALFRNEFGTGDERYRVIRQRIDSSNVATGIFWMTVEADGEGAATFTTRTRPDIGNLAKV